MRAETFQATTLASYLRKHRIATLPELKQALGTSVHMTVFRKLKELGYRTSYSHNGKFYTLDEVPQFDDNGLWSSRGVGFSRYGTLVATAEAMVTKSRVGYFGDELESAVGVRVDSPLRELVLGERLWREPLSGRYLYCATEPKRRERQMVARRVQEGELGVRRSLVSTDSLPDEVKAAIVLFYSFLDERQRRLYAGLEALQFGRGGDREIANLLDVDVHTVSKGRRELLLGSLEPSDAIRRSGGGRRPVEKNAGRSSRRSKN